MRNESSWNHAYGTSHFRHAPLDQKKDSLRLVKVLPDLSTDGLVECSIHHAVKSTPYICLSYTWGSSGNERAILISRKLLMVRRNLEAFLYVARTQLGYCFLWIDAICINQANAAERDHQVQRMGNIFAKAKMLITWLG
ncbi:HET-domain-containing protein, partial [Macroventuria anomochaeta]